MAGADMSTGTIEKAGEPQTFGPAVVPKNMKLEGIKSEDLQLLMKENGVQFAGSRSSREAILTSIIARDGTRPLDDKTDYIVASKGPEKGSLQLRVVDKPDVFGARTATTITIGSDKQVTVGDPETIGTKQGAEQKLPTPTPPSTGQSSTLQTAQADRRVGPKLINDAYVRDNVAKLGRDNFKVEPRESAGLVTGLTLRDDSGRLLGSLDFKNPNTPEAVQDLKRFKENIDVSTFRKINTAIEEIRRSSYGGRNYDVSYSVQGDAYLVFDKTTNKVIDGGVIPGRDINQARISIEKLADRLDNEKQIAEKPERDAKRQAALNAITYEEKEFARVGLRVEHEKTTGRAQGTYSIYDSNNNLTGKVRYDGNEVFFNPQGIADRLRNKREEILLSHSNVITTANGKGESLELQKGSLENNALVKLIMAGGDVEYEPQNHRIAILRSPLATGAASTVIGYASLSPDNKITGETVRALREKAVLLEQQVVK